MKTQIVLEQQADIADFVACGGQPVQSDAESKAGIFLGVNTAAGEHVRMHHAGAENLDPAAALAYPQPLPPHSEQVTSTSTLGSVKGKKEGRNLTLVSGP